MTMTRACPTPHECSVVLDLQAELERLQELLRGVGANRYWEGRWRDEKADNERLAAALEEISREYPSPSRFRAGNMARAALEQKADK
jgi:hypothetical protein